MNRSGHEKVKFFIGKEVEHSAAYGKRTLFIVGVQSIEEIEEQIYHPNLIGHPIEHLYFGANHSFNPTTAGEYIQWDTIILHYLKQGFWCTLDMDVRHVENFLDSGLTEYNKFIPMISVKLPYINQLGYNAVLKIDDRDFDATNPGVWCHRLHDLQANSVFTSWDKYSKDEIL
jgi:hypothetical protein